MKIIEWFKEFKYKGITGISLLLISTILNSIFENPFIMWVCFFSFCYMLTYTFCYIFAAIKNFKKESPVWGIIVQVITIAILIFVIYALSHFVFNY
jgi:hypothetical protein